MKRYLYLHQYIDINTKNGQLTRKKKLITNGHEQKVGKHGARIGHKIQ